MNSLRTKLGLESLEAREQMSAGTIDAAAFPIAASIHLAQVAANGNDVIALNAASSGVTRVPPTARDLTFMSRMANKKWQLSENVVNPYTGGTMHIIAEIVFVANGTFTLNEVGQALGSSYYASSSGAWWVQNNGRLVLHHVNTYPAQYWPEWQFMHLQAVNKTEIVSSDGGTWIRIPRTFTSIPLLA